MIQNPFDLLNQRLKNIEVLLIDIKHSPNLYSKEEEKDEFLDIKEAAFLLKYSLPSMYRLVKTREIPSLKKAGKILFSKEELIKWAKEGRRKTVVEINEDAEKYLGTLGQKKSSQSQYREK